MANKILQYTRESQLLHAKVGRRYAHEKPQNNVEHRPPRRRRPAVLPLRKVEILPVIGPDKSRRHSRLALYTSACVAAGQRAEAAWRDLRTFRVPVGLASTTSTRGTARPQRDRALHRTTQSQRPVPGLFLPEMYQRYIPNITSTSSTARFSSGHI